jgi:hypothetical protein
MRPTVCPQVGSDAGTSSRSRDGVHRTRTESFRVRPKMMTVAAIMAGLLPIM